MRKSKATIADPKEESPATLEIVQILERDIIEAIRSGGKVISRDEIRFLVDAYYQTQEDRKGLGNRIFAAGTKTMEMLDWYFGQKQVLEKQIVKVLDAWTDREPVSRWAKSVTGIGPLIAAGLAAHIDMSRVRSAGQIWRFAGLDPTQKWIGRDGAKAIVGAVRKTVKKPEDAILEVAQKAHFHPESIRKFATAYGDGKITWVSLEKAAARCPWNQRLKVLCWKIGDSFVKNSGRGFLYGDLYLARKALEVQRSETGEQEETARMTLEERTFSDKKTRKIYESGKLPDGRLDLRARRYAVKMFLAHWFEIAWKELHGTEPPKPYPIQHLGHVKWLRPEQKTAEMEESTGEAERAARNE